MTAHYFDSSGEAYDACQCDDSIQNGDVLVIACERVVGLAYTWPFVVTAESGALHHLVQGHELARVFLLSQVKEAIAIAHALGFPIHSSAQRYAA